MNATTATSIDEDFKRRIEGALKTVQAWEDPQLLADCRKTIPWDDLRNNNKEGPYSHPDDSTKHSSSSSSLIFFQRFCRYFQTSMTWVHQPACPHCQTIEQVQFVRTRGPETTDEVQGQASRVELYQCKACNNDTTFIAFPRYNAPRTLLQTRQGRCGEYANLFGLYCRAVGYATRYILDMTDHVWVEICIPRDHHSDATTSSPYYCMGDGCEGVIDEPSMYEAGWGKELSYVLAITPTHVMDVTPRYTRQFTSQDLVNRRRNITTSENAGRTVLQQINQGLLAKLSSTKQRQAIQKQCLEEETLLSRYKLLTEWKLDHVYHAGRISGAIEWKLARGEDGLSLSQEVQENQHEYNSQISQSTEYTVQSFLPSLHLSQAYIEIKPRPQVRSQPTTHAIVVSGAPCAMGIPNQLSAVVVDPQQGTILQSKSFVSVQDLERFVTSIPDTQILAVHGQLLLNENDVEDTKSCTTSIQQRLPLWKSEYVWDGGIIYVGAVGPASVNATWNVCAKISDNTEPIVLRWNATAAITIQDLKLRIHQSTRPNAVIGRLPDSYLSLATQSKATFAQKQEAFESFLQTMSASSASQHGSSIVGFCTKLGSPIYLISANSYPLQPSGSESSNWATFVLLPAWLVPQNDIRMGAAKLDPVPMSLSYEVPLEVNRFVERLGPQLSVNANETMETAAALQKKNPRLIAFYFSAHWCGPCRSFTPMLIEFYHTLNESFPSHGLEIVLVSSDRDQASFQNYYTTMPWLAIPFTPALEHYKAALSFEFGVQGIPSLVILDAISGAVVVDARTSRGEIQQSCRRGDEAIAEQFQIWLQRLPAESQDILNLLQVSCHETQMVATAENDRSDEDLLGKYRVNSNDTTSSSLECGLIRGKLSTVEQWEQEWRSSQKEDWKVVVKTALQYVANARREPWNPKYRTFHWSNVVADRINNVLFGLTWWRLQGLDVYSCLDDYVAWIPVHVDLDSLHARWSALLDDEAN